MNINITDLSEAFVKDIENNDTNFTAVKKRIKELRDKSLTLIDAITPVENVNVPSAVAIALRNYDWLVRNRDSHISFDVDYVGLRDGGMTIECLLNPFNTPAGRDPNYSSGDHRG